MFWLTSSDIFDLFFFFLICFFSSEVSSFWFKIAAYTIKAPGSLKLEHDGNKILVLWLTDRTQRGYRPASRSRWPSDPRPWASLSWCCWRCWPGQGRGWSAAPCARGRCRGGWGRRSRRRRQRGRRAGSRWWCRRWSDAPVSRGMWC